MKKHLFQVALLGLACLSAFTNCTKPTPPLDPTIDNDGDGWAGMDGDLDDANPLVNPGAYEILGNGLDDDCDPSTSDAATPDCSTAAVFADVTPLQAAAAMGLCRTTTEDPPLSDRRWGVIGAQFLTADGQTPAAGQLANMEDWQVAILTDYGTGGVLPRSGATMVGISTGKMRDAADTGYAAPYGGTSFGYSGNPPAAYLAAHGGDLPASYACSGTCPAGTGAYDSVNLRLSIRTPTNARGFAYDHIFFSAEYESYACSAYNDFHLALLSSGAAGIPADHNITFDSNNNPITVNTGFFAVCVPTGCYTCPLGNDLLTGTGMDTDYVGGATGWLSTVAPVVPGETITLELMIFDVSDGNIDSNVLLDNFHWIPSSTTVGTEAGG